MDHKSHRRLVIGVVIIVWVVALKLSFSVAFVVWVYGKGINITTLFCFLYITIYRLFYAAQFVLAANAIRTRFKAMNKQLRSLKILKDFQLNLDKNSSALELANLFHHLCDGINITNKTFAPQTVYLLTGALVKYFLTFSS